MPDIDRQLFRGTDALSNEDWLKVSAPDLSPRAVGAVLEKYDWSGKAAAAVGIRLTADNTAADSAKLLLAGGWGSTLKIPAKQLFSSADEDIILEIEIPDLAVFRCADGDMWSRYTPQEAIKYSYRQGEKVLVDEDEMMQQGISDFSLRAITGLSKACGAKFGIWLQVYRIW